MVIMQQGSRNRSCGATRNAVMYSRVSSKDQEREGFSIPAQECLLRGYANQRGLVVVREFVDVETAKESGRPGFAAMLAYLKAHRQQCRTLLVEKTDRLYRNLKDYSLIDDLDVELHFVKENVVISKNSRSSDKLLHGIRTVLAKNYIDNLSEEVKKGLRAKAELHLWPSFAPLGYLNTIGPDGKRIIVPDPVLGPMVSWQGGELRISLKEPFAQLRLSNRATTCKDGSFGLDSGVLGIWRRKRDSNPRVSYPTNGFQDRRLRPLGHSSTSYPT
jgi:DNA invertase Pin-like site-specific DNA recombinase